MTGEILLSHPGRRIRPIAMSLEHKKNHVPYLFDFYLRIGDTGFRRLFAAKCDEPAIEIVQGFFRGLLRIHRRQIIGEPEPIGNLAAGIDEKIASPILILHLFPPVIDKRAIDIKYDGTDIRQHFALCGTGDGLQRTFHEVERLFMQSPGKFG